MDNIQERRTVAGYLFMNDEDAELARQELKKIEYLEKHINYNNVESILRVYKKALVERVFKTPVGFEYLKKMQLFLRKCGEVDEEDIPPLVLYQPYKTRMRASYAPARQRVKPADKPKTPWPVLSLIFNLVLVVAVAAMFVITMKSDNPNILNYETNLINKYAAWEQELTERESVIREKEKELHISVE